MVIASHHQLRVNGALLVGGIGVGADRSGGVLPLLEHLPGQLLLQLVCGLLPGLTSAVAHLYRVIARAWVLSSICDCLGGKGLNELLTPATPHPGIADANKFAFSSYNLC